MRITMQWDIMSDDGSGQPDERTAFDRCSKVLAAEASALALRLRATTERAFGAPQQITDVVIKVEPTGPLLEASPALGAVVRICARAIEPGDVLVRLDGREPVNSVEIKPSHVLINRTLRFGCSDRVNIVRTCV